MMLGFRDIQTLIFFYVFRLNCVSNYCRNKEQETSNQLQHCLPLASVELGQALPVINRNCTLSAKRLELFNHLRSNHFQLPPNKTTATCVSLYFFIHCTFCLQTYVLFVDTSRLHPMPHQVQLLHPVEKYTKPQKCNQEAKNQEKNSFVHAKTHLSNER